MKQRPQVKDILEKNDKDLSGRFFDARIRLAKGNADEAISLLQGVVKDEPKFAERSSLPRRGISAKAPDWPSSCELSRKP